MIITVTERLIIRHLELFDAPHIVPLFNSEESLRFIGNKKIHSLEDARTYLKNGPLAMYAARGFGLYAVTSREDGAFLGISGLIQRDTLKDVDVGYGFLPEAYGRGFASEAAVAMVDHARSDIGLKRLVAITKRENIGSVKVLEKIGMQFETEMPEPDVPDATLSLYGMSL